MTFLNEIKTVFFSDKYKKIPLRIRLKIYLTKMSNPYNRQYDNIIEECIKNIKYIKSTEKKSNRQITINYINGTIVGFLLNDDDYWSMFLSMIDLDNYYGGISKLHLNGRPSRLKMLDFILFILNFYHFSGKEFHLKSDIDNQTALLLFFDFKKNNINDDLYTRRSNKKEN